MHVFKSNALVDELVRLSLPSNRKVYGTERYSVASILAAKFYQFKSVSSVYRRAYKQEWAGERVIVGVIFRDSSWESTRHFLRHHFKRNDSLILIGVDGDSVEEIFNGKVRSRGKLRAVVAVYRLGGGTESDLDEQRVPHLSDEEIARRYGAGNGGGAGDGGGPQDGEGDGDGSGGGGVGEVLDHPILFSLDVDDYNRILEQT